MDDVRLLSGYPPQELTGEEEPASVGGALIVVIGAATVFSEIGFALVGHLMDIVYGWHRRLHCANLAQLRDLWGEEKGTPTIITADCPDTPLSYLLASSSVPILAFFDDPVTSLAYPVVAEGQSLDDAIRFGTRRFSCLMGCVSSPHVQIFGAESRRFNLTEMVEAVFAAVGLNPVEAGSRVVERMCAAEGVEPDASITEIVRLRLNGISLDEFEQRFDSKGQSLVAWFADNYGPILQGQESEIIEWPLELFNVDPKGERGGKAIDLVGGARYLVWGPNLHLPFGAWRARLQFEVAENTSGNEIYVDVCLPTTTPLAFGLAKLPLRGYFQLSFDFVNADPNAALQIRVRLTKGAIEGRLFMRKVALFPIDPPDGLKASLAQPTALAL